jgi:Protein of unknown function (DUF2817)
MLMNPLDSFSSTYTEARDKFLAAAQHRGARLGQYLHPTQRGPAGDALYLDVAVMGELDAQALMVVGCGTHGIEGYSGSAAQTAWMHGDDPVPAGAAMVFLHAHNPWGFAHHQRVTEENVDLNRNFIDFSLPPPANPGYIELASTLTPKIWDEPNIARVFQALARYRELRGEQAYSDAFNGGQYTHPEGVYFGGLREQWATGAIRAALREHVGHARHAAMIDLHTGIGNYLEHVYLCFHAAESAAYERAKTWWGERAVNRAGSTHKATARYRGLLVDAFQAELSHVETTATVIEFGTRSREAMQRANLSLCWLRNHGATDPAHARKVHHDYIEAFYPSEPEWRRAVLEQSREFMNRGLVGVAGSLTRR